MEVTIIIINRNTKQLLNDCLHSVVELNKKAFFKYKIEVVVVDNGSGDGSIEMIKEKYPKVRLIINKKNNGFAKAVNQGILTADSKSDILLLNSDVVAPKDSLEKLIIFSRSRGNVIVGPLLLGKDGSIQRSAFDIPTLSKILFGFVLGKKTRWFGYITSYDGVVKNLEDLPVSCLRSFIKHIGNNIVSKKLTTVGWVTGAVMYIPRVIVDNVGLMDTKYFFYFDEVDYCRRAAKYGYKIIYNPGISFFHFGGGSSISKTVSKQTDKWMDQSTRRYWGEWKYKLLSLIIKVMSYRLYN